MQPAKLKLTADEYHNAILVLNDGSYFLGNGVGVKGERSGEICFNTSLTGYQEILTDPSYAKQIITFTFPHIGNVGCNPNDEESQKIYCSGLIIRETINSPSNYRAIIHFNEWLIKNNICGICGIDTRELTRHIRRNGASGAIIYHAQIGDIIDIGALKLKARNVSDLTGVELTKLVTTKHEYSFNKLPFSLLKNNFQIADCQHLRVVVIDYGVKHNILCSLVASGCSVIVVPATHTFQEIMSLNPDGIFLSNGPGDPNVTFTYIQDTLEQLINSNIPIFGICMGHQLLAIAFKLGTVKMQQGHRGSNHPVKNLKTGMVEITSQNHGFCVAINSKQPNIEVTHLSLFDNTIEGLQIKDKPIFSVQYHPESSPGPEDSRYLFKQFINMIKAHKR